MRPCPILGHISEARRIPGISDLGPISRNSREDIGRQVVCQMTICALAPIVAIVIGCVAKTVIRAYDADVWSKADKELVLLLNDQVACRAVDKNAVAGAALHRIAHNAKRPQLRDR